MRAPRTASHTKQRHQMCSHSGDSKPQILAPDPPDLQRTHRNVVQTPRDQGGPGTRASQSVDNCGNICKSVRREYQSMFIKNDYFMHASGSGKALRTSANFTRNQREQRLANVSSIVSTWSIRLRSLPPLRCVPLTVTHREPKGCNVVRFVSANADSTEICAGSKSKMLITDSLRKNVADELRPRKVVFFVM